MRFTSAVIALGLTCGSSIAQENFQVAGGERGPKGLDAQITIFRESKSFFANYKAYSGADKGQIPRLQIMMDGQNLTRIDDGRFVTLRIPVGKHTLQTKKYTGRVLDVDLHPGERLFLRPGAEANRGLRATHYELTVIPCSEAIAAGKQTEPVKGKDIGVFPAIEELRFPQDCEQQSSEARP